MATNKIQALLVNYLYKYGSIKLILPDGISLEIGVNQEGENNYMLIENDYCWVIATRQDRSAMLDSYNLGLRFTDDSRTIVFEDTDIDGTRSLDVV